MVIALGIHLFPFRTEKLSPTTSMVLRKSGRVDSRRFFRSESESSPWRKPIQFWVGFFRSRQPISHVDVRVFLKQYFCPFPFVFLSSSGMKSCSRPECSFFRDRVFGWQVCPPRRYVWFACNARIVMSQDPAGARIGGINDPTVQWRKPDLDQNSTLGV